MEATMAVGTQEDSVRRLHESEILKRYNVSSLWAADGPTGHPMTARIPRRWLHSSLLLALAALGGCQPNLRAEAVSSAEAGPLNVIVMINDGAGWGTGTPPPTGSTAAVKAHPMRISHCAWR